MTNNGRINRAVSDLIDCTCLELATVLTLVGEHSTFLLKMVAQMAQEMAANPLTVENKFVQQESGTAFKLLVTRLPVNHVGEYMKVPFIKALRAHVTRLSLRNAMDIAKRAAYGTVSVSDELRCFGHTEFSLNDIALELVKVGVQIQWV